MSDVKPVAWVADLFDPFIQDGPQRSNQMYYSFDEAKSDCDEWDGKIIDQLYSQSTVTALQAEIEARRKDAVDAARWRALQKNRRTEIWTTGLHAYVDDAGLDEQADAAIAKEK